MFHAVNEKIQLSQELMVQTTDVVSSQRDTVSENTQ